MTAPAHTTRTTPTGARMDDGFKTLITFAADVDVDMWEKTVQPPGFDGGDAINTSTMHNTALRTFSPASLQTMTPHTFKFALASASMSQIRALINVKTTITVRFPDAAKLSFYGYLQKVEFDEFQEGTQPEGTATIVPTNYDPTAKTEEVPVYGT